MKQLELTLEISLKQKLVIIYTLFVKNTINLSIDEIDVSKLIKKVCK